MGIRRQKEEAKFVVLVRHELFDRAASMDRMTVKDEKHRMRRIVDQTAQELDEHQPVDPAFHHNEP